MAKHTLVYPANALTPVDLLNFSELDWFVTNWNDLELDEEDDLAHLQITIMCDPLAGDVVPGTGGLRKLRYAPLRSQTGKRGGLRVCYVYFEKYSWVTLVTVYRKGQRDDISAAAKARIRDAIARIETALASRFGY